MEPTPADCRLTRRRPLRAHLWGAALACSSAGRLADDLGGRTRSKRRRCLCARARREHPPGGPVSCRESSGSRPAGRARAGRRATTNGAQLTHVAGLALGPAFAAQRSGHLSGSRDWTGQFWPGGGTPPSACAYPPGAAGSDASQTSGDSRYPGVGPGSSAPGTKLWSRSAWSNAGCAPGSSHATQRAGPAYFTTGTHRAPRDS